MQTDIITIALGFLEGFALIISPCILPILPIILTASLTGNKNRPLGIIIGFILTFTLFTFFSRALVRLSGIDLNIVRDVSYMLLFAFGLIMLSTFLTEKFTRLTQRLANTGSSFSSINNQQGGLLSGILFGGLVALIWTPCAGPILAAVIVQSVLQKTTLMSFLTVLAFGIGAAVPMFFIVIFGRKVMTKFAFFKTHAQLMRKLLGLIIIASVIYMIYGEGIPATVAQSSSTSLLSGLEEGLSIPYAAPEIAGISAWINSSPLTMQSLKGKVVLIDFWTYSCINCIRTLPYLKDWYQKYHDKGFVIVGVHSPEFEFEKELANVKTAVQKFGITYPVALDNQFETWTNFNNRYWPAHYLIDKNGMVVYEHFGEGKYDVTEHNIQHLLGVQKPMTVGVEETMFSVQTPETYLGYARSDNFASPQTVTRNLVGQYTFPDELAENNWALQGAWLISPEKIVASHAGASLKIHFQARKVFVVMGNATGKPISVSLLLNGEKVILNKGKDVVGSEVIVDKHRLYEVVDLKGSGSGVLQLSASSPGLEMYAFTFGG